MVGKDDKTELPYLSCGVAEFLHLRDGVAAVRGLVRAAVGRSDQRLQWLCYVYIVCFLERYCQDLSHPAALLPALSVVIQTKVSPADNQYSNITSTFLIKAIQELELGQTPNKS